MYLPVREKEDYVLIQKRVIFFFFKDRNRVHQFGAQIKISSNIQFHFGSERSKKTLSSKCSGKTNSTFQMREKENKLGPTSEPGQKLDRIFELNDTHTV